MRVAYGVDSGCRLVEIINLKPGKKPIFFEKM